MVKHMFLCSRLIQATRVEHQVLQREAQFGISNLFLLTETAQRLPLLWRPYQHSPLKETASKSGTFKTKCGRDNYSFVCVGHIKNIVSGC